MRAAENKKNELSEVITKLHQENKQLKDLINNKEKIIFKLQSKFDIFEKLKPIFDEFHKEYPNDNPVKVIEEVQQRKAEAYSLIKENEDLNRKIKTLEISYKKEIDSKKTEISAITNQKKEIEKDSELKLQKYLEEISYLKQEKNSLKEHETESLKLQSYLYSIYNKLVDNFAIDKNYQNMYIKNKANLNSNKEINNKISRNERQKLVNSLKVKEADFQANMFDNETIKNYINAMIINSSNDKKSELLREVMAYSNMMIRTFAKDKLKNKFDPVSIFKIIKEKLLEYKGINKELKDKIKILQENLNNKEKEQKILHRDIDNSKRKYVNLERKFDKKFGDQINKIKRKSLDNSDKCLVPLKYTYEFHENELNGKKRLKEFTNNIRNFYNEEKNPFFIHNYKSLPVDENGEYIINNSNNNINYIDNKYNNNFNNANSNFKDNINFKYNEQILDNSNSHKLDIDILSNLKTPPLVNKYEFERNSNNTNDVFITNNNFMSKEKKVAFRPSTSNCNKQYTSNSFTKDKIYSVLNKPKIKTNSRPLTSINNKMNNNINININYNSSKNNSVINNCINSSRLKSKEYSKKFLYLKDKNKISHFNSKQQINNEIELSKNKDKLIKKTNKFSVLPIHLESINSLVNHTNRLFLYKTRSGFINNNNKNFLEERNMFLKFKKLIDNNAVKINKITRNMHLDKNSTNESQKIDPNEAVINKINKLLYKFKNDS